MNFSLKDIDKNSRQTDFWLLFFWNIVAFGLSFVIGFNYLITAFLFFVIPSLYLSYKRKDLIKKTAIVSLVFTITLTFIVDYLVHQDGGWQNFSVINFYLFDSFPIDDFLWGYLYFYYIFIFYEYFFDRDRNKAKISTKFKYLEIGAIVSNMIFILAIILFPDKIKLPYAYTFLVVFYAVIFPIILFQKEKKIFSNIIKTGLFFSFLSILYEYVANVMGNWTFPGNNFLGFVTILDVTFPLEELFWLIFTVPAMLIYYEFFADDGK